MLREMKVLGLSRDEAQKAFIVILGSEEPAEMLPIWIGGAEAQAIMWVLEGIDFHRPLTHDLFRSLLEQLGARLIRVVIHTLEDQTYYARLEIQQETRSLEVDTRPSDAIALALRCEAPILVDEEVLEAARTPSPEDQEVEGAQDQLKQWLKHLKPEDFGEFKM